MSGASNPPDAAERQRRYHLRLLFWLILLALVLLYAWNRQRQLASDWKSPTSVALVIVDDSRDGLDAAALTRLREGVPALEARLREEFERYRPGAGYPFHFSQLGPVRCDGDVPGFRAGGLLELVVYNFELWRFSWRCDKQAGLDRRAFTVRLYLRVRSPRTPKLQMAEGVSQHRGPIGLVEVELHEASVDFALFVAAHELMHTRGASDKYGPDGLAVFPEGFAEPDARPLFPQRRTEVMARGRPLDAEREEAPSDLDELTVGKWTALEIGWLVPP